MEPASPKPETGMVMFDVFPAIQALGQERLQQICNDWLATDDAQELGVTALTVGDASTGFALFPQSSQQIPQRIDERLYTFTGSLLRFIVTNGLPPEQQALGERILQLVTRPPGMLGPEPAVAHRRAAMMASSTESRPASGPDFSRRRRPMSAAQAHAQYARLPEPVLEPPKWLDQVEAEEASADRQ